MKSQKGKGKGVTSAGRKRKLKNEYDTSPTVTRKGKRNRLLKKNEKADIVKSIKAMELTEVIKAKLDLDSQPIDAVTNVIAELVEDAALLQSLLQHHQVLFIRLYERNSIGKQKYLKFQIEWQTQCSILLLPK
jgi:hypothetical protein